MNKFGIFKLLNSFLNFAQQSKNESNNENVTDYGLGDIISALSSQNNSTINQPNARQGAQNEPTQKKVFPPLQNSMLSVMNSHDEFIKRVQQRNKIKQ